MGIVSESRLGHKGCSWSGGCRSHAAAFWQRGSWQRGETFLQHAFEIRGKQQFMRAHLSFEEPCFTMWPVDSDCPDWKYPGSRPAKESILEGFLNLLKSPYSERITAADNAPIPGIERMGGSMLWMQSSICCSSSSTMESI